MTRGPDRPPTEVAGERSEEERPTLLFFFSPRSGVSRRVEGYLAQVLQRRSNHETFLIRYVDVDERSDVAARLAVTEVPTLLVVEERCVRRRLVAPGGCRAIAEFLAPWLH